MVLRRDCITAIIPIPFVKCCYMFCIVYLMFKGVDIIFLSAHLMFLVAIFHVLLRLFHVFILEYF